MCYRVIRDSKRRAGGHGPRAEDDQCPAYYGVDYRTAGGKLCAAFTVHEGTKTLREKSAPADRRHSRVEICSRARDLVPRPVARFEAFGHNAGSRGNVLKHPTAVAVYRRDLGVPVPRPCPHVTLAASASSARTASPAARPRRPKPVVDVRNPSRA